MLNDNYNKLSNSIFHLLCLKNLKPDEILIIFGKGIEEYQEINGKKHFYSDSNIIKEFYEN